MEVKCTSPIFKATGEPQSPAQALGSSSDAKRHHGSGPVGKGSPEHPLSLPDPTSLCNVPCPPLPSCKCASGFVYDSQSITPGLAGRLCPSGDSPQCHC